MVWYHRSSYGISNGNRDSADALFRRCGGRAAHHRAAERLNIQQPYLSQLIKSMEEEIGARLFHRRPRGVDLTAPGQAFFEHAKATLAEYDRTIQSTKRAARGEEGRITVGVMPTAPFHPFVPSVIRSFRAAHPHVAITLDECLRQEALDRLRRDDMDVAFMRTPLTEFEGLAVKPLLSEPMLVALPADHRLSRSRRGRDALELKDLANETFIIFAREKGPAIYEATLSACLKAGFSPRLGQEAPRITSALNLVAAGLGICIVPESMRRMVLDGISYRLLEAPELPTAVLNLCFRRGEASPVVRRFIDLVAQSTKEPKAGMISSG
jgi:DNA-binding transcriptional LysR family regulator